MDTVKDLYELSQFFRIAFSKDVCERLFLGCFLELVHCSKNGLNQL